MKFLRWITSAVRWIAVWWVVAILAAGLGGAIGAVILNLFESAGIDPPK